MRSQGMRKYWRKLLPVILIAVILLFAGCGTSEARNSELSATEMPESAPHVHEWSDGICKSCGAVCSHRWHDGVCRICGKACDHAWYDGVCGICYMRCEHEWNEGICRICGEGCAHYWRDGVCTRCGAVCPHTNHDAESGLCEICGSKTSHEYLNGKCTRCGEPPSFITKLIDLPADIKTAAEEHGEVEIFYYAPGKSEVLPGEHGMRTYEERKMRNLAVYTPAGYDPEQQYNVLIIAPGAGHNASHWLERANLLSGALGRLTGREMLDRLIEHGQAEPMIVAVVEYYLHISPDEVAAVYKEDLRERILPFLAENYGTYASVSENGTLIAAPEHFGFVGASYGSMIGWRMLPDCSDLFSYWCLLSGAFQDEDQIIERINKNIIASRKIHWLYTGDGNQATGWKVYENHMKALDSNCWNLELGKNFCFVAVEKAEHSYSSWDVGLFNSLQVFFHSRYVPVRKVPTSSMELLPS